MILPFVFATLLSGQAPRPVTVPFTLLPSRHIAVAAEINGKGPYWFILDTGAPINIISFDVAKDVGLSVPRSSGLEFLSTTPRQVVADRVGLGGVAAERLPFMRMDHPTVEAISSAAKLDRNPLRGILGFPFLARYAVTIDYQDQSLTLTPNGYKPGDYLADMVNRLQAIASGKTPPRIVAPAGFWGLNAEKSDDTPGVIVSNIDPSGPADKAGLRVGDRILTLDGRWTDSVTDFMAAASPIRPGQSAELIFVRDGLEKTVAVTPINGL